MDNNVLYNILDYLSDSQVNSLYRDQVITDDYLKAHRNWSYYDYMKHGIIPLKIELFENTELKYALSRCCKEGKLKQVKYIIDYEKDIDLDLHSKYIYKLPDSILRIICKHYTLYDPNIMTGIIVDRTLSRKLPLPTLRILLDNNQRYINSYDFCNIACYHRLRYNRHKDYIYNRLKIILDHPNTRITKLNPCCLYGLKPHMLKHVLDHRSFKPFYTDLVDYFHRMSDVSRFMLLLHKKFPVVNRSRKFVKGYIAYKSLPLEVELQLRKKFDL
jgi:hypothetical protein